MTHTCHAWECEKPVKPDKFMCYRHWAMVPARLRDAIWQTYRRGQEDDKEPSDDYLRNASEAIKVVAAKEGREVKRTSYDALLEGRQRKHGEILV